MANHVYPKFGEALFARALSADIMTLDLRAILVDTASYTYNSAHDFLDDVPAGARASVSGSLAGVTWVGGLLASSSFTFTAVPAGPACEAIILYIHTGGADSARRLIGYYDSGVSGLPVTPSGANIEVTVPSGWMQIGG